MLETGTERPCYVVSGHCCSSDQRGQMTWMSSRLSTELLDFKYFTVKACYIGVQVHS